MISCPLRTLHLLTGILLGASILSCHEWSWAASVSEPDKRQFVKAFLEAEKNDAQAQYALAMMYYSGQQIPQDKTLAVKWFTKAAQQGHSASQYFLSLMYGLGDGVAQDEKMAVSWCEKAARQGHADAQYSLGRMYSIGQGVKADDVQAVSWLSKAAQQGHMDAQCDLGSMYQSGRGVTRDINQATQWWVKAAQQGHAWAGLLLQEAMQSGSKSEAAMTTDRAGGQEQQLVNTIGGDLGLTDESEQKLPEQHASPNDQMSSQNDESSIVQQDFKKRSNKDLSELDTSNLDISKEGADRTDLEALHVLPKSKDQSVKDLSPIEQTDPSMHALNAADHYDLAMMFYEGTGGLDQDYNKAFKSFRAAAEEGHAQSQYKLGTMYSFGQAVSQDTSQAVKWFRAAAEQGLPAAQYSLGVMYATGQGVQSDPVTAIQWYTRAAENGSVAAQFMLGMAYSKGQGVTRDSQQALQWYIKAAEQGAPAAQYLLAVLYEEGKGVVLIDNEEAMKWYIEAAYNGHPQAQYDLAEKYFSGQIVERDNIRAYMWCLIAGLNGKNVTQYEQQLESRMTESQLEQSRHLAREMMSRIDEKISQSKTSTGQLENSKSNSLP